MNLCQYDPISMNRLSLSLDVLQEEMFGNLPPMKEETAPLPDWIKPGFDECGDWETIFEAMWFDSWENDDPDKLMMGNVYLDEDQVWYIEYMPNRGPSARSVAPAWLVLHVVDRAGYPMSAHNKMRLARVAMETDLI